MNIKISRRRILTGLGLLPFASLANTSYSSTEKSFVFVLVHGAWHGGWCWKKVKYLLEKQGHTVYTPTLTGLGERSHLLNAEIGLDTHILDIVAVLEYEDLSNIILVGHSYAGMVITGVAGKVAERISHLVYLDAFLPENGKALKDYLPLSNSENEKPQENRDWKVPPRSTAAEFGVSEKQDIEWAEKRLGPQSAKTFVQPVVIENPIPDTIKKVYMQLTDDSPWFVNAAERARKNGFQILSYLEGGHDAMISQPGEIAEMFISILK
jgi:pimeloyl-ACP methyl ester carboxylesterase